VSSVAIASVVWFTSTSWRRDQICEPYKVAFKFTVPASQKPNQASQRRLSLLCMAASAGPRKVRLKADGSEI